MRTLARLGSPKGSAACQALEDHPLQDDVDGSAQRAVPVADAVEQTFREASGRAVATLVRLFGDIDIAEEAVQDAFVDRSSRSGRRGYRRVRPDGSSPPHATEPSTGCGERRAATTATTRRRCSNAGPNEEDARRRLVDSLEGGVSDDQLRLIFTCCHPALVYKPETLAYRLRWRAADAADRPRLPGVRVDARRRTSRRRRRPATPAATQYPMKPTIQSTASGPGHDLPDLQRGTAATRRSNAIGMPRLPS